MRFTVRDLVYIGVFGALWGVLELSFGALLHLFNLPFTGGIMVALGISIALIGRMFVPKTGSIFLIGVVAALLKLLSMGGVVINPLIGILIESALAELAVSALGRPSRISYMLAGILAALWTVFQPVLTMGIMGGAGLIAALTFIAERGAKTLGAGTDVIVTVLAILIAIHALFGIVAGILGWEVGRTVHTRRTQLQGAE